MHVLAAQKMNRCQTCVIPDTRPDTHFVDGICSACHSYAKRPKIDWEQRRQDLMRLLEIHNGRVIVPSSGGKDSTYQVLTLVNMGADVTVVTASTCHLTLVGRLNIDNLARYARTVEITPDRAVRAKLNRLGLELVGDISWPEHASIFSTPFRYAVAANIPLIMYGENPQSQYGGPPGTDEARQMTRRWTQEFGGFLGLRPSDFVGQEGITERQMKDYELPSQTDMDRIGVEAHFLGQYIPWDSHRNAQVAADAGMIQTNPSDANWWPAENLDNAQTGIHDYFMFLKYGFGRGCQQISVDVRSGLVPREFALKWVEKHDGKFPSVYMGVYLHDILERIGMTMSGFNAAVERFTDRGIHGSRA